MRGQEHPLLKSGGWGSKGGLPPPPLHFLPTSRTSLSTSGFFFVRQDVAGFLNRLIHERLGARVVASE